MNKVRQSHLNNVGKLQSDRAMRNVRTATKTVALVVTGRVDSQMMSEFAQLQFAVWRRCCDLGETWTGAWEAWLDYAIETGNINTQSKLAERGANVLNQAGQLVASQIVDLAALQENIEIDYGFWISSK